jgi:hypothetical protein
MQTVLIANFTKLKNQEEEREMGKKKGGNGNWKNKNYYRC